MFKRLFALLALAASIGIAACSPGATTSPTLGPTVTESPSASLPLTSP
jgi:hypothetical protein